MKLRNLLEDKEPEIKKGRKQITIICNDSYGALEKFLRWWKSMGDIGHSAIIHCDVDQPTDMIEILCDGDGSDRTESITVKMLPDED